MQKPATAPRMVEIATLGERLSALRLCDADALTAMRRSLEQHGQLSALPRKLQRRCSWDPGRPAASGRGDLTLAN